MPEHSAPVIVYDRGGASVRGLEPRERIAACYRWASASGKTVTDQVIAWDAADGVTATLAAALDACLREGADLLVYADECIGDTGALTAAGDMLGASHLLRVIDAGAPLCGVPR